MDNVDEENEKRRKRLEELKQQSLDIEREAQEREKKNEERKKQREEQLRQLQEQEKKDEEERIKRREERKRLREEEEKRFKEEMERLDAEKANRANRLNNGADSPLSSDPTSPVNGSSEPISSSKSSSFTLDDPELRKQQEEREKRIEERRKQREETERQLALEEKRIAEEREKRKEERERERLERERASENEKLQKAASSESERLEKQRLEVERLEKERLEKEKAAQEAKDKAAESERLEQQRLEVERLEKEKLEKEKAAQEAKDKAAAAAAAAAEAERIEKEKLEKEKADKEKAEQEAKEKERLEKEKADKEKADKEKAEQERIAKEKADKEEKERLDKEKAEQERIAKEKSDKEKADKEKAEQERVAKEKADKEKAEQERIAKEKADKEKADKEKAEQERIAKEKADKEKADKEKAEQDRIAKEKADKEKADKEKAEQERIAKEKADKEKAEQDRVAKEKADKEKADKEKAEQDRIAKEKADKEKAEQDRVAKEKADKEKADKEKVEQERIAKEKADKEKAEQERIAKEKADKEKADKEKAEQERVAKEKADKEKADKEKAEQDRIAKEKADKEKADKEKAEQERIAKEKADKEKADKERLDKIAKDKADKEKAEQERIAKEKSDKEKADKERIAKEKADKERIEKEKQQQKSETSEEKKSLDTSKITDVFKSSIEKQLQSQLEKKNTSLVSTEPTSLSSPLDHNMALDKARIKGRKPPTRGVGHIHASSGGSSPSSSTSNSNDNSPSLLSQALENKPSTPESTKKKLVLPPGAQGGLLGGMAALAMEAQKKKLEKDNNKLLQAVKDEAPSFVRGRSQSVSVSSTLKQEPGKFLSHKKTLDTYSGLRTRLIHCKGKKRICTKEVEVSINSLNKCDAFVLDCGIEGSNVGGESVDSNSHSTIYTWYGSKASANKKAKAVAIAEIIKSHERGGHATITKLDEGDDDPLFYKKLGGTVKSNINPEGGDDLEAETHWAQSFTLLKYNSDTDSLVHVDTKSLSMEVLHSDGFFVLDTGTEFYEWSGKNSDQNLKENFHKKAQERLKKDTTHRQAWVEAVITSEGGENVLFREKFFDWPDLSHEVSLSRMGFGKKKAFDVAIPYEKRTPTKMNNFEVREMVEIERAEEELKSTGNGEYEIWYVDNMKIHPLPKEEYGHFYSGNCYLLKYTYTKWNALKYIIFYWQGIDSIRQDIGASSLLSKDMYIETSAKGDCVQECERMGRESTHFLSIFNGRMVVHRGTRTDFDMKSKRLYHVFGRKHNTIVAIQSTRLSSTALNSRDVFIATDSVNTFVWESKGHSKALKEESSKLASLIGGKVQNIKESSEPEAFWKLIGGNGKYANYDYIHNHLKPKDFQNEIKLFAIINTGTIIRAEEIYKYSQYDLTPSKVFILDNKKNVFVWVGSKSQEKEKKRGTEIAIDYLKYLNDSRTESDVLFINEKDEPLSFTCFFHAWDSLRFHSPNGADLLEDITSPKVEAATSVLKKYYQVLPFEQLIQKNTPPEIDRAVLEMYLSDEDFEKHLGMNRSEWDALPAWKRTEKEKSN
ncbi:hypothetical protein CYY_001918 [Polysphondylium violaceum]|uniref:HP domain-containing protein n=1 Tax=Polysphondylium violaceum TaxID=133409 RepID=A0A8J4Q138_9MYCE|nr:hypothetical protein CYY_001918 [Polysphondylium violaceum]